MIPSDRQHYSIKSVFSHDLVETADYVCDREVSYISERAEIVDQLSQLTGPEYSWMLTGVSGAVSISTLLMVAVRGDSMIFDFSLSRNANSKLLSSPWCIAEASVGAVRYRFCTSINDFRLSGQVVGLVASLPMILGVFPTRSRLVYGLPNGR